MEKQWWKNKVKNKNKAFHHSETIIFKCKFKIWHYNTKQCLGGIIHCLVLTHFIHSLLDNLKFLHTFCMVFFLNIRSSLQIILCLFLRLSSHLLDKHIDFSWSLIDGFVSFIWWINGQMYSLISQKFRWEILFCLFDGYTEKCINVR